MKTCLIAAETDVNLRYSARLRELIAAALADDLVVVLVVDMRRVTFVDGTGLAILARACKRMQDKGGSMQLHGVQPRVLGMFDAMHMTALLNISSAPPLAS